MFLIIILGNIYCDDDKIFCVNLNNFWNIIIGLWLYYLVLDNWCLLKCL